MQRPRRAGHAVRRDRLGRRGTRSAASPLAEPLDAGRQRAVRRSASQVDRLGLGDRRGVPARGRGHRRRPHYRRAHPVRHGPHVPALGHGRGADRPGSRSSGRCRPARPGTPTGSPMGTVLHDQLTGRLAELLGRRGRDRRELAARRRHAGERVGARRRCHRRRHRGSAAAAPPDPTAAAVAGRGSSRRPRVSPCSRCRTPTPTSPRSCGPGCPTTWPPRRSLGHGRHRGTCSAVPATGTVRPLAWPAEGTADRAALTADRADRRRPRCCCRTPTPPPCASTSYTPSGIGPLSGTGLTAVVRRRDPVPAADHAGRAVGRAPCSASSGCSPSWRWSGSSSRRCPARWSWCPPRGWTPDPAYVHGLLQALGARAWVQVARLADLTRRGGSRPGPAAARPTRPGCATASSTPPQMGVGARRAPAARGAGRRAHRPRRA